MSNDIRSEVRSFPMGDVTQGTATNAQRVLRNTYALLGLTLAFSAAVAGVAMSLNLPHPGLLITLAGFYGLFFLVNKFANSGKGVLAIFALTGFMGYTLGPTLNAVMTLPGGSGAITSALGATAAAFLGLSAIALTTKRDFSFMGKFLMIGMLVAVVLSLGGIFFQIPALSLAVSGMVVLLASGLILFETSRIVNGGETNYVMATVSLFVSIYNLFSSLLMLCGLGGGRDD